MLKKKLQLSIFILIACLTTNAYTQDKANLNNEINEIKTQNKILQQSLEELKNHSAELNAIYMWALGFSATFLITFLGVNIYFLNSKSANELEKINANLKMLNQDARVELEEKIDLKMEAFSKELESHKGENAKALERKHKEITRKLNELRCDMFSMEICSLNEEDNGELLLNIHIKFIEFILNNYEQDEREWQISKSLAEVISLQKKGSRFSSYDFGSVSKILSKLPPQYSNHADQIKSFFTV